MFFFRTSGGKSAVNSLKFLNSCPISISSLFNKICKIACVAQALLMTWLAKNTFGLSSTSGAGCPFFLFCHLNKKIKP